MFFNILFVFISVSQNSIYSAFPLFMIEINDNNLWKKNTL
jgi:hypothetical protein